MAANDDHSITFIHIVLVSLLRLYCDPRIVSPYSLLSLKDHAIHCDSFPVLPGPKNTFGQGQYSNVAT